MLVKKRHFQLLEVMVAILILMLCAAPALEIFTRMYIAQERIVRINERDHLVRLVEAKIVERLYKNSIPVEDFSEKGKQQFPFSDPELDPLIHKLAYGVSYKWILLKSHKKKGATIPDKYLVELKINMKDNIKQKNYPLTDVEYSYTLNVNAGAKISKSDKDNNEDEDSDDEDEDGDDQDGEEEDSDDSVASESEQKKMNQRRKRNPPPRSGRTKQQNQRGREDDLY